jgi:hypothetical protein
MATRYRRIQVTEDPELASALRAAAPYLPGGLPRSRAVRDLAIAGADHLAGMPYDEGKRRKLMESLAARFEEQPAGDIDWDLLREGKRNAWPSR